MVRLEYLRDLVRKHNEQAQDRQAKAFDKGKREREYKVGEEVWRRIFYLSSAEKGINAKLCEKFEGPYKIAEVLSPNIYLLDLDGKSQRLPMVHSGQLKPYVPRDPRWIPAEPVLIRKIIEDNLPEEPASGRVLRSHTRKQAAKGKGQ